MQAMNPARTEANRQDVQILVVDDEPEVIDLIRRYFSTHGLKVTGAQDGASMRQALAATGADLVLLDLGLPDQDGLSLLRQLSQDWGGPVIIVTGRGDAVDRVVGLEIGADDYVSKPFDLRELLARVRSVLRRSQQRAPEHSSPATTVLHFDGFELELETRSLRGKGVPIELTTGEFELLKVFAEAPQRVLTRDQLMNAIHGRDSGPFDRAIDVQIGRLRRKIEADPGNPALLKSVRGVGYLLATSVQRSSRKG